MDTCMATKTISLELDAYERLKRAKRGKESFSAVVRRARFPDEAHTGASILASLSAFYDRGSGVPKSVFDYWDNAVAEDSGKARVSDSEWDRQ